MLGLFLWIKSTYLLIIVKQLKLRDKEAIIVKKQNWNRLGKLAATVLIAKFILTSKKKRVK